MFGRGKKYVQPQSYQPQSKPTTKFFPLTLKIHTQNSHAAHLIRS